MYDARVSIKVAYTFVPRQFGVDARVLVKSATAPGVPVILELLKAHLLSHAERASFVTAVTGGSSGSGGAGGRKWNGNLKQKLDELVGNLNSGHYRMKPRSAAAADVDLDISITWSAVLRWLAELPRPILKKSAIAAGAAKVGETLGALELGIFQWCVDLCLQIAGSSEQVLDALLDALVKPLCGIRASGRGSSAAKIPTGAVAFIEGVAKLRKEGKL